ncbi:MAG: type I polyketide synthase, partial [Myxococcota bacterium]
MEPTNTEGRVAIVGWAGRFPGAPSVDAFWRNLTGGVESLVTFDEDSVRRACPRAFYEASDFVPRGYELADTDQFDAEFFGIGANEAQRLDPQHRLFLECCWEAVEDAGYDVDRIRGRVGVYASSGHSTNLLVTLPKLFLEGAAIEVFQAVLYGDKDWVAPYVSFKLGFTGPSMGIQTGCSSSLFAVHQACQSLLVGESRVALAGAVSVRANQRSGYRDGGTGLWSPDGRIRPFDARAEGTVFSNAVGVVVLKRLEDALADGDHVHAVLAGSAVNNDGGGRDKASFAAPTVDGQRRVIEDALAMAALDPEDIGFVEAHGTGTPVGDVIEVTALNQAFSSATAVRLGSLKGNIGHAECASGMAGLIKTALCVQRGEIPPTLNHVERSAAIDWRSGPFRVVTAREPWESTGPRRAGVSSFGAGGTNAHVIVEQAPADLRPIGPERPEVLLISARSPHALHQLARNLADHLRATDVRLGDVAHTLRVGRRRMAYRAAVAARTRDEAAARLSELEEVHASHADAPPRIAFVFPGAGPQTPGMSRRLHEVEPVFRDELASCLGDLPTAVGDELRRLLIGPTRDGDAERLARPSIAMPALFAHCAALLRLLGAWGIRPDLALGHSFGEYVAAYAAGAVSRRDAIRVVRMRGELLETLPDGAMLGVRRGADAIERLLCERDGLSIAAINAPELCVVSGARDRVDAFGATFDEGEAFKVHISTAGHSPLVDPIVAAFAEQLTDVRWSTPTIPLVSNVTGERLAAVDAAYWARHLRAPVRFADGLRTMMAACDVAVEVGPGTSMSALVGANREANRWAGRAIPTMRHPKEELLDEVAFHRAIGELWSRGAPIDEARFADPDARRTPLPTYPFERRSWSVDLDLGAIG